MFSPSSPPAGLLEKVFQYIDLHQDEFVQVGEMVHAKCLHDRSFGYLGKRSLICGEVWISFLFFFA